MYIIDFNASLLKLKRWRWKSQLSILCPAFRQACRGTPWFLPSLGQVLSKTVGIWLTSLRCTGTRPRQFSESESCYTFLQSCLWKKSSAWYFLAQTRCKYAWTRFRWSFPSLFIVPGCNQGLCLWYCGRSLGQQNATDLLQRTKRLQGPCDLLMSSVWTDPFEHADEKTAVLGPFDQLCWEPSAGV